MGVTYIFMLKLQMTIFEPNLLTTVKSKLDNSAILNHNNWHRWRNFRNSGE